MLDQQPNPHQHHHQQQHQAGPAMWQPDPFAQRPHAWAPQPRPTPESYQFPWPRLITALAVLFVLMCSAAIGIAFCVWLYRTVSRTLDDLHVGQLDGWVVVTITGMVLISLVAIFKTILSR